MININETALKKIQDDGILTKIVNFFKKIISKNNSDFISTNVEKNSNNSNNNNFLNRIKYTEDPDKMYLLKIQDELERRGINKENAFILTKNLSEIQKQKLELLYKEQIDNFKLSINNSKNTILRITNQLN